EIGVRRTAMPEKRTIEKARKDKRAGKAATTQAGEFVHEEIRKIRRGEHGARSPQQAIAIGLSKARRAGVDLAPPGKGKAKERTRRSAAYAYRRASTNARLTGGRASRARCRGCSSASRGVRCRVPRWRGRREAPPRAVPPRSALVPHARRRAPRAKPFVRPRHARRLAPGRGAKDSQHARPLSILRRGRLWRMVTPPLPAGRA